MAIVAPLIKKKFIADDTKKFVGRGVELKQKYLKELLEILALILLGPMRVSRISASSLQSPVALCPP